MRSTEGLRPKIGRKIQAADNLSTQAPVERASVGLKTAANTLPAALVESAPVPQPQTKEVASAPRFGLGQTPPAGDDRATAAAVGGSDDDTDIDWDRITSIFKFLLWPALFAILIIIVGIKLPRVALYAVAAAIGGAALVRAQRDPEILLALMLMYIPFAHLYAISIAPLVNGTNIFIGICLVAGIVTANKKRQAAFAALPGFKLVVTWFVLSSLSIVTLIRTPGALSYTLGEELTQYTGWVSQFGFYLAVYSLVKTPGQAKRAMVYLMLGTVMVVLFGMSEALDKIGLNSIEKQRLGGVFEQPNDYGGFVAYTFIPFLALFLFNMGKIKAWLLAPYFVMTLKVLITTFSRGAYVAFAVGGFLIVWLRGKAFMLGWGLFALGMVSLFPQILPDSVLDRINQTGRSSRVEKLDKSSEDRFIMWDAAIEMTMENPITGKGFKAFPYLKDSYTKIQLREGDPHNMYLYISSQMGLPTLLVYFAMMLHTSWIGYLLYRRSKDGFERVIGASVSAVVPCLAFINMFGSRMVGMSFVAYFYAMVVILQVLYAPHSGAKRGNRLQQEAAAEPPPDSAKPAAAGLGKSRLGMSKA